jgi:hypothetical protein
MFCYQHFSILRHPADILHGMRIMMGKLLIHIIKYRRISVAPPPMATPGYIVSKPPVGKVLQEWGGRSPE